MGSRLDRRQRDAHVIPFGEHPADAGLYTALLDTADELIRLTGAGLCDWNKTVEVHDIQDGEGDQAALGIVRRTGAISLREDVLTTLRDMWSRSPQEWTDHDRARQLIAVMTVPHELTHLLVPVGERYSTGRAVYSEFPGRALEEGITELATAKHVGAFAGAEARSPGVTDPRNPSAYPQFVPAAQIVVRYVGELGGGSQDAVLNSLVRETVPGKFRRLSQMVLQARGTWDQIPPSEQDGASAAVINAVWGAFQANRDWASSKPRDRLTRAPEARSWIMGLQVVAAAERARLQVEARYSSETPETPWPVAAARYEQHLARQAVSHARSSNHPDVRQAAGAWMQRAVRRVSDATKESRPERPQPDVESRRDPEAAAVPRPAAPLGEVRPRRSATARVRVHRRPGRSDPGRDR